jgi:glycosyltransferase involved in cell wall biosynthesis
MNTNNVLHVVAGMAPELGGVCKAIRFMIAGLETLEIYNEVVSLDCHDARHPLSDSFPIHALGPGKTAWCYSQKLLPWLKNNLGRFGTVIIHGVWLYPGFAVTTAMSQLRKQNKYTPKVFVMPHGMLDPYFQKTVGRKLKAIRNSIFWRVIEYKMIKNADGLLFTCEMEKQLAKQTFSKYRPQREIVVGLGIDTPPTFDETMTTVFKNKIDSDFEGPYWLYISRIHQKKGVDLLVNAYVNLKRTQKNLPRLLIAGPGLETNYGRHVQQLASESSDIYFTGMLNGDAKWGAFYGCEAFILPSHQENFGIAIVEAMACGKPVLITSQINIWKEIKDSGAGIVTEDTLEKTEHMLQCWTTLSLHERQTMGVHAKNCFQNYFSLHAATQRLQAVINN